MRLHVVQAHDSEGAKCYLSRSCLSSFFRSAKDRDLHIYKAHVATRKDVLAKCPFCPLTFSMAYIVDHCNRFHVALVKTNKDICELCGAVLDNEEQVVDHLQACVRKKNVKAVTPAFQKILDEHFVFKGARKRRKYRKKIGPT